jgi:hypothetical protein
MGARAQHGQRLRRRGQLSIAVDGKTLAMEPNSPGMDVFGFKHPAATDAESAAGASANVAQVQIDLIIGRGAFLVTAARASTTISTRNVF